MLKNYLKITIRNFTRNKLYTGLNLLGLTVGMAACLIILQYVSYEWSYDRFHTKADHLYRIINDRYQDGKRVQIGTITYPAVGPLMDEEYPEIVNHTRILFQGSTILQKEEEMLRLEGGYYVDNEFLNLFSFELLAGDRTTALQEPHQVVLTEKAANHFFDITDGNYDKLLGQNIQLNQDDQPYQITGILADVPANSLLQPKILGSYATLSLYMGAEAVEQSLTWSDFYHYLEVQPGTDIAALERKLEGFSNRHFKGEEVSGAEEHFYLQPLKEAHLNSMNLEYEIGEVGSGRVVWALLVIALFILALAWVNYINLSSVRAIERAKEVGIRRVAGAGRGQLVGQFLTEAALINAVSLTLGVYLAYQAAPLLSNGLGINLSWQYLLSGDGLQQLLLAGLLGWLLLGILFSGFYPAFLLGRQQTALVLKGQYRQSEGSQRLRKGLVVFQFAASIALVSVTWMVFQQVRFMTHQNLGVNIDQVLRVSQPEQTNWDSAYIERVQSFKDALTAHPGIKAVTASSRVPGERMGRIFGMERQGLDGHSFSSNFIDVDHEYAETYGLETIAGRDLRATDHHVDWQLIEHLTINESAAEQLGFERPEAAVGAVLRFGEKDWTVVGVLQDFHQMSFHHVIEPIVFLPVYHNHEPFSVRISGKNADQAIDHLAATYTRFYPGNLLEYEFLDERVQNLYEADQRFGNILLFFTILAILVACLGLFGLASYMAFLRTKEVGIRKVLGASVLGIVRLLSKDFVRLVGWAALIATPLAWLVARLWLQDFAYRIDLPWWVFFAAGGIAILIALLTVSYQAARAALANPVEALRRE